MVWCSSMSVTLLECAVTKNVPASPLECAVTKLLDLKSRGISSYKKCGGWGYQCGGWWAFDIPAAEESRNQKRGAEVCRMRKLLRRGYDAVPVEDLDSDRVAGIIPVCLG